MEIESQQQTTCCQRNQTRKQTFPQITWHWLIKHPVEFSKNNHTPPTNCPSRAARPRGTRSTLLSRLGPVNRFLPVSTYPFQSVRTQPSTQRCIAKLVALKRRTSRTAAAARRKLVRFPAEGKQYPLLRAPPNRPPVSRIAPAQAAVSRRRRCASGAAATAAAAERPRGRRRGACPEGEDR